MGACSVSGGTEFVRWPEMDSETRAFLLHEGESRSVLGPFGAEGPDSSLLVSDAPMLILELEPAEVDRLHPFIDLTDWSRVGLEGPDPACVGCERACLRREGSWIEAAIPASSKLWSRRTEAEFAPVSIEGWPGLRLQLPADMACAASEPALVEAVAELPRTGSWAGTLPAGATATWVWGSDLLLVGHDGEAHALSTVRPSTGWISHVVRESEDSFLVSANQPSEVLRVSTSSSGITVTHVWTFEAPLMLALAKTSGGGFVAIVEGAGLMWGSEAGEPPRPLASGLGRTFTAIIPSPFAAEEFILSGGSGSVWSLNPFLEPMSIRDLRVTQSDKQVWDLAVRPGPAGPELWAATNQKGIYSRSEGDAEWARPAVSTPLSADSCANAAECGFFGVSLFVEELDVAGPDVLMTADQCPALLRIRPDRGCTTRLDLPTEYPSLRGLSSSEGWLWALSRSSLVRVRLE